MANRVLLPLPLLLLLRASSARTRSAQAAASGVHLTNDDGYSETWSEPFHLRADRRTGGGIRMDSPYRMRTRVSASDRMGAPFEGGTLLSEAPGA